uniref:Mitochondrial fission factor n=1 Tax=Petromyzon marinus TaxID=7757 RepID=S4RV97_PETMA
AAECNRVIFYDPDFTQDISEKMRIPNTLKVASTEADAGQESPWPKTQNSHYHHPAMVMEVPERIMVADSGQDSSRSSMQGPRFSVELPREMFHLQTPPRVLTLEEQPLDYISLVPPASSPSVAAETPSRPPAQRGPSCAIGSAASRGCFYAHQILLPNPALPSIRADHPCLGHSIQQSIELGSQPGISQIRLTPRTLVRKVCVYIYKDYLQGRQELALVDDVGEDQYADGLELDLAVVNSQVLRLAGRLQAVERAAHARQRREVLLFSLTGLVFLLNGWLWLRR